MQPELTAAIYAATRVLRLTAGTAEAGKKLLLEVPVLFCTHLTGFGSTPKWPSEQVAVASDGKIEIEIYEPGKPILRRRRSCRP